MEDYPIGDYTMADYPTADYPTAFHIVGGYPKGGSRCPDIPDGPHSQLSGGMIAIYAPHHDLASYCSAFL